MSITIEFKQHVINMLRAFEENSKDNLLFLVDIPEIFLEAIVQKHGGGMMGSALWKTYLDFWPLELRQENKCYCCYKFVKYYGGLIMVNPTTLEVKSIWEFDSSGDEDMKKVLEAMASQVKKYKIREIFYKPTTGSKIGDLINGGFYHFSLDIPNNLHLLDQHRANLISNQIKEYAESFEFSLKNLNLALKSAQNNDIPRGEQFAEEIKRFIDYKNKYDLLRGYAKHVFIWVVAAKERVPFKSILAGQYVADIRDYGIESANRRMASRAGVNYQRPEGHASVTEVEALKKFIVANNLTESLNREIVSLNKIDPNYLLFSSEHVTLDDPLAKLTASGISKKSVGREITLDSLSEYLNNSSKVEYYFDPDHINNLVSLIGPTQEGPVLTSWPNGMTWTFKGGNATKLTELVKKAGGNIKAPFRFSLGWDHPSDLDLHCKITNQVNNWHIYFASRSESITKSHTFSLDVDANAHTIVENPVENIYGSLPEVGRFKVEVSVHLYTFRPKLGSKNNHNQEVEFKAEALIGKDFYTYKGICGSNKLGLLTVSIKDGVVTNITHHISSQVNHVESQDEVKTKSTSVWGIKTKTWIPVTKICKSPNYWESKIGNPFLFIFLQDCKWGESSPPRGIFNECIRTDIKSNHKQALEVLGSLIKVNTEVGQQCSGVGFNNGMKGTTFNLRIDGKLFTVICE